MSTDNNTHPGFDDHASMQLHKQAPLDPHKQAPKEVKDAVWDMVQGRSPKTVQDAPDTVTIPKEYVQAVAWHAVRELKRRGCGKGFSVKIDPDVPQVFITWERPSGLATAEGNAYQGATDCLTAFVCERPPEHVGTEAVDVFLANLDAVMQSN
jgi:hypothetical protein